MLNNKSFINIWHSGLMLWKNISTVTDWFKNIPNKRQSSLIQFDVENFNPSISLNLFNYAIQYASEIIQMSNRDIKHSRKTLLFNNNQPWEKKSGDPDFDVPIAC